VSFCSIIRVKKSTLVWWSYFWQLRPSKFSSPCFTQACLQTIIQGQNYSVHSQGLFCIQLCWVFLNKNGWSLGVCSMLLKGSFCSLLHIVGVCVKVIHPKYSKHWIYTVVHTIDYVCSKILNHGLSFSLFKFFGWKNICTGWVFKLDMIYFKH
jgi:hypothetical protein